MRDQDALATSVVMLVKTALAPLQERCAALEARLSALPTHEPVLTDLRDRLVTMEAKSGLPALVVPEPVDLSPVLERVAASEARLETLVDLRDRLVTVETKTSLPILDEPEDDIADRLTVQLRKALATFAPPPVIQKRVIRDGQGAVKYEIEETR